MSNALYRNTIFEKGHWHCKLIFWNGAYHILEKSSSNIYQELLSTAWMFDIGIDIATSVFGLQLIMYLKRNLHVFCQGHIWWLQLYLLSRENPQMKLVEMSQIQSCGVFHCVFPVDTLPLSWSLCNALIVHRIQPSWEW